MDYINSEYGLPCILIGSKEDIEMNKACLDLVKSKSNFSVAGDFNLLEFVALCTKAKLYIGNDSGPLHLAASTGVPLIALFSNAVKIVWYPKVKQVKIHHYFLAKNHEKQTVENSTIFNIKVDEVKESVDYFLK
jgi:heptosyltransferase-3